MEPVNKKPEKQAWYQQPIMWLAMVIFLASLAGCIGMIMLGLAHKEAFSPAPHEGAAILGVPLSKPSLRP